MTRPLNETDGSPPAPRRRWFLRPQLFVGSTLLALLVGELGLQIVGRSTPHPLTYPGDHVAVDNDFVDAAIGWKRPPHDVYEDDRGEGLVTYRMNALGFRGERPFAPAPEQCVIAFLGDSFTYGVGVAHENTFAQRVEAAREDTVSYNFGIRGFGVDQMWCTLEHYALAVEPDIVVVSFIIEDLARGRMALKNRGKWWSKPTFRRDGERLVRLTEADRPRGWLDVLRRKSRVVEACRRVGARLERTLSRRYPVGETWHLNRALFHAIRDVCREHDIKLLVMHIPGRDWQPFPSFAKDFAEAQIEYLDLADLPVQDPPKLFLEEDSHMNAAGHAFAAAAILEACERLGWSR